MRWCLTAWVWIVHVVIPHHCIYYLRGERKVGVSDNGWGIHMDTLRYLGFVFSEEW